MFCVCSRYYVPLFAVQFSTYLHGPPFPGEYCYVLVWTSLLKPWRTFLVINPTLHSKSPSTGPHPFYHYLVSYFPESPYKLFRIPVRFFSLSTSELILTPVVLSSDFFVSRSYVRSLNLREDFSVFIYCLNLFPHHTRWTGRNKMLYVIFHKRHKKKKDEGYWDLYTKYSCSRSCRNKWRIRDFVLRLLQTVLHLLFINNVISFLPTYSHKKAHKNRGLT